MATLKAIKAKEDARHKELQDAIDGILAAQVLILEQLHEVFAKLNTLAPEAKGKVKK